MPRSRRPATSLPLFPTLPSLPKLPMASLPTSPGAFPLAGWQAAAMGPWRLATSLGELSVAAPQVIAHRVGRMAVAGPSPSARDRREFTRMGAEKVVAFQKSWFAMVNETVRLQTQLMSSWWRMNPWDPAIWTGATRVAELGLKPVHRTATANARRLGRVRA